MEMEQTGGEGFEHFDEVSSTTAHGMTMMLTRESGKRVKDTIGKNGPQPKPSAAKGM